MTDESKQYYRCPYNDIFCVLKFHADQHYSDAIPIRRAKDYSEASEVDAQLFSAADVGDMKLLQKMLKQGADVNFQHCAGTPLTRAARRGHVECVQALLEHGADINMSGNFNCQTCTALHAAASNGHYEVAQLLLDHGADVHAKRDQGSTPLHDAAKFGHPDIAELLLQHGALVNAVNSRGKTPLFLAGSEGKLNGLRWVLEAIIEYYHYRGYHYNKSFFPKDAVNYLLDKKDKVNALNMNDLEDLRIYLLKDDLDALRLIVEDRPAGNLKHRHLQLLKILLDAGANTEIFDNYETGLLEEAIINKDEECISFLLKNGAVINRAGAMFGWKATPLHFACCRGTEGIMREFLESGGDPNGRDEDNKTPLHVAADERNAEFVQLLIKYGAKVDEVDNNGATPLHEVRTLDCAKLLIEHGADATAITKDGKSVLFKASGICGEGACVQFLIDQGADPLKADQKGKSPLDSAVGRWYCDSSYDRDDGGLATVKILLEHGAKLKETNYTLHKAIAGRWLGLAFAMLELGIADVNAKDVKGSTTLFLAAQTNFTTAVEMLLERGADPHMKCKNMTPLDVALLNGSVGTAKVLVQSGAYPSIHISHNSRAMKYYVTVVKELQELRWQDSEGNSEIHLECYRLSSIIDCLDTEVDINIADKHGITPLHIVCYIGSKHHVRILLERKADVNIKDKNGLTALHFAAFMGDCDVGALLLENGADASAQDVKGRTALHVAAQCGCTSYLELLITHGADINTRDNLGSTALHQAERNGHTQCVELLLRHAADSTIPTRDYIEESTVPPHVLENISKFESAHPESEDESDIDLGFGLF